MCAGFAEVSGRDYRSEPLLYSHLGEGGGSPKTDVGKSVSYFPTTALAARKLLFEDAK